MSKFSRFLQSRIFWIQSISISLIALCLVIGFSYAWNAPTCDPTMGNPSTCNVSAPLNVGTTTQTKTGGLNVNGNVGIGTTNPGAKLDVNGTLAIRQGYGSGVYSPYNYGAINFARANNDNAFIYPYIGNNSVDLRLYLQDDQDDTEKFSVWGGSCSHGGCSQGTSHAVEQFHITAAGNGYFRGNVGIGTTNPAQKLHVNGNIRADGRHLFLGSAQDIYGDNSSAIYYDSNHNTVTQMIFRDRQNTQYGKVYGDGNGANFGLLDGNGHWSYLAAKNNYTQFRINNSAKMTIKSNGNIGIGTTNPGAKLDVNGTIKAKTPIDDNDVATKKYVDNNGGSLSGLEFTKNGVTCPIWKDCDGDGYTYGNGDCDESCKTCYVGSKSKTSKPDGKDQNCNGVVDELIKGQQRDVGNDAVNYSLNGDGKSCNEVCSGLGAGWICTVIKARLCANSWTCSWHNNTYEEWSYGGNYGKWEGWRKGNCNTKMKRWGNPSNRIHYTYTTCHCVLPNGYR